MARGGEEPLTWWTGGKQISMDVARGLIFLHGRGVIHGDLKAQNILLTSVSSALPGITLTNTDRSLLLPYKLKLVQALATSLEVITFTSRHLGPRFIAGRQGKDCRRGNGSDSVRAAHTKC